MTVCVLLLWLSSLTVSHVAWGPPTPEHCRSEPTCAEHRDWRAAWCGTRRIPPLHGNWQLHKTGKQAQRNHKQSQVAKQGNQLLFHSADDWDSERR